MPNYLPNTTYAVPASFWFADKVNAEIPKNVMFAEVYGGILSSFKGDPNVGQKITNTDILWENATQVQQLAFAAFGESGRVVPQDMQTIMDAVKGPEEIWNLPYSGWPGLVAGSVLSPTLKEVSGLLVGSGVEVSVITPA